MYYQGVSTKRVANLSPRTPELNWSLNWKFFHFSWRLRIVSLFSHGVRLKTKTIKRTRIWNSPWKQQCRMLIGWKPMSLTNIVQLTKTLNVAKLGFYLQRSVAITSREANLPLAAYWSLIASDSSGHIKGNINVSLIIMHIFCFVVFRFYWSYYCRWRYSSHEIMTKSTRSHNK